MKNVTFEHLFFFEIKINFFNFLKNLYSQNIHLYPQLGKYPEMDPFLSPLTGPNWILSLYPPLHVIVGEMDVLLDDCVELVRRMVALKKTGLEKEKS